MAPSRILSQSTTEKAAVGFDKIAFGSAETHLLRNEQMSSVVSTTGAGGLYFEEMAITRRRIDRTADASGYFIYLRDLDSREYWSAGYQPTLQEPTDGEVRFRGKTIEFSRSDHEIQSTLCVCLSADGNVELRRCELTNQSSKPRRIELTSYLELVLQNPQADAAHPAFSKLFVETEMLNSGVLVARRRKREDKDEVASAVHFLAGSEALRADEFETDRCRFLGRGQDLSRPRAMQSREPLSGTTGSVLDPVFSLRRSLYLAPGESVFVTFGLGASLNVLELPEMAVRFADSSVVERIFRAALDAPYEASLVSSGDKHWRVDEPVSAVADSHLPPLAETESSNGEVVQADRSTRVYSPSALRGSKPDYAASADALVIQNGKAKAEELLFDNGWGGFSADGKEYVIRVGAKSGDATERPPMPWANIIANRNVGFIVSESGAGYTWAGNSRLNRLTRWHNDPVSDPHSDGLYIRDEERGVFWSPTPGPVRQDCDFEVRHGFGYTKFLHTGHDFQHEVVQFVPREDDVKITCVRLKNLSDKPRRLTLFSYHQWELGDGNPQDAQHTQTVIRPEHRAVFAKNEKRGVFSDRVTFASLSPGQDSSELHFSGDRQEFLGPNGQLSNPLALQIDEPLSGVAGAGHDPCAACQAAVEIQPGETLEYVVLLGEADCEDKAAELLGRYRSAAACYEALTDVQGFWRDKLSIIEIRTPSPSIDLMVNGWLSYQNLSCRIWGRSSTYQSGGAYGFRDQLQDAAAWMQQWPELTREQILRNAAHQFVEGDVLHWWHPPESLGIRTTFSDDLLWLPLFAAEYVAATGEVELWQEEVRFLKSAKVPEGEAEVMVTPDVADETGTVYEHCCRALDRGLTTGEHGLPLIGCGDWNDGMNRVGQAGAGESVWLGFFIDYILELMLPVCEQFGDQERLARYLAYREDLRNSLNDAGWDGEWYRRAYFDDGTPLGSAESDECQIDALVQAWAVLSGAAPAERANKAMSAAEERLVNEQAGLIQLLDPPFNQMAHDPGYIKGYLPGIRENGGQYTHGVLWFIRAVAELGKGSRAVELLEVLSPINHGRNVAEVNGYQTEPYVIAADVYSQAPHEGRGGWSWYTGSADWMWRVAVESILGIRMKHGKTLVVDPRISADWPECTIQYRLPSGDTTYTISIQNPDGKESGVTSATHDGVTVAVQNKVAEIPLQKDGETHEVVISL